MFKHHRPKHPQYKHGRANAGSRSVLQHHNHTNMNLKLTSTLAGISVALVLVVLVKTFR